MRRAVAVIALVVLLGAACSRPAQPPAGDDPASGGSTSTDPAASPTPEVVQIDAFIPLRDDVYIDLKRTAGRVVQHLSTYTDSESWSDIRGRTSERFDISPRLLSGGRDLHVASTASVSEIVYPQLGGLDLVSVPQTASVMVVVQQSFDGGSTPSLSRTVDVRMERDDRWRVVSIDSVGGDSTSAPDALSQAARAVVENPAIELADSARWDIYRGEIDERVLRLMSALARDYTFSVTVLKSGHPPHVYGTANTSNHTEGRAVDIWEVDGRAVVSQRTDASSAAYRLTQGVFGGGEVPEIGSPWDFDAGGSRSFTNDVHLDHIHLGYDF